MPGSGPQIYLHNKIFHSEARENVGFSVGSNGKLHNPRDCAVTPLRCKLLKRRLLTKAAEIKRAKAIKHIGEE
jgi:hypothetical protein